MIILNTNYIDTTTTLTASSTFTRYPLSNLLLNQLYEYTKLDIGFQTLNIAFNTVKTFDTIAIAGHKLVTASFKTFSDAGFTTSTGSYSLDCTQNNIWYEFAAPLTSQYVQLSMIGSAVKQIGNITIGSKLITAGLDPSQEWTIEINDSESESMSFNVFGSMEYTNQTVKVKYAYLTLQQKNDLQNLFLQMRNWKPFYMKLWNKVLDYPVQYVRCNQNTLPVTRSGSQLLPYTTTITFRQVQ